MPPPFLHTLRAAAVPLLAMAASAVGAGPFTPALAGESFGLDFNPTADRIRLVSDAEAAALREIAAALRIDS